MESIRKLCVPHACLQLMHYLQAFGDYQKWCARVPNARCGKRNSNISVPGRSVDLVEIVAREDSPLFSDFEPTCAAPLRIVPTGFDLTERPVPIGSALHKLLASVPAVCINTAAQDYGDAPRPELCNVLLG